MKRDWKAKEKEEEMKRLLQAKRKEAKERPAL